MNRRSFLAGAATTALVPAMIVPTTAAAPLTSAVPFANDPLRRSALDYLVNLFLRTTERVRVFAGANNQLPDELWEESFPEHSGWLDILDNPAIIERRVLETLSGLDCSKLRKMRGIERECALFVAFPFPPDEGNPKLFEALETLVG